MVRVLRRLAIVALFATACGPGAATSLGGPQAADTRLDPTERIVRLHVAIDELRDDPDATAVALELSRAATWIARAEALTRTKTDPDLRDLLLETAEGQVTMVRSRLALERSTRRLHGRNGGAPPDRNGDTLPPPKLRRDDADASPPPPSPEAAPSTEAP